MFELCDPIMNMINELSFRPLVNVYFRINWEVFKMVTPYVFIVIIIIYTVGYFFRWLDSKKIK